MEKTRSKSTERKIESDFALSPGLRLAPISSARLPVESEFPIEETFNDPEQRQRAVGRLIDFFKKY
jgi:hypothetical protein